MDSRSGAEPLLAALAVALSRTGEVTGAPSDAATRLAALVATARGALPRIEVPDEDFVVFLAERLDGHDSLGDAVTRAARMHVTDLYLACACARGDRRAVAAFEERFLSEVPRHVRKLCDGNDDVDEIKQILRTRMLVSTGGDRPKILGYTGRGPLAGWLRVAAVRAARDLSRKRRVVAATNDEEPSEAERVDPADPELAVIRAKYGQHFRAAFDHVLAELSLRERNILAMTVLDGLSTDAVGALYGVDGSTVRRWVARARERVLDEVRARLKTVLAVRGDELDSLMGAVRSQLDLNLSQLLVRAR